MENCVNNPLMQKAKYRTAAILVAIVVALFVYTFIKQW